MATTASLTDSYNDNSLDTSKWTSYGGYVNETNSQLVIAPPSNSPIYSGYKSNLTYDLTASQVVTQVVQTLNSTTGCETRLILAQSSTNQYMMLRSGSQLVARIKSSGVDSNKATATYSTALMQWWRIREASGTIYWEYSSEGTSWTTLYNEATSISITGLTLEISAGTYQNVGTPGTAIFDNFNLLPAAAETLSDNFNDNVTDTDKWSIINSSVVSETGGQLVISPADNTGTIYSGYASNNLYNLANSQVVVHMIQGLNNTVGCESYMRVYLDANNFYSMLMSGSSNLTYRARVSGSTSDTGGAITFASVQWWKIKASGGTITWETSPDGATWTVQRSRPVDFSVTNITIQLYAGTYTSVTNAGTAQFDDFNLPPVTLYAIPWISSF